MRDSVQETANSEAANRSCSIEGDELFKPTLNELTSPPAGLPGEYPLSLKERIFLGFLGCCLTSLFIIASTLNPAPRGYGTHEQLGLPPCTLRTLFGIPCPTCGMTTSFAHLVRGELALACRVNPAGLVVAGCCLLFVPWSILSVIRGKLLGVRAPLETSIAGLMGLVGISLIVWVIQIC